MVDLLERAQSRQVLEQVPSIAPPDVPLGFLLSFFRLHEPEASLSEAFVDHCVPARSDVHGHAAFAAFLFLARAVSTGGSDDGLLFGGCRCIAFDAAASDFTDGSCANDVRGAERSPLTG